MDEELKARRLLLTVFRKITDEGFLTSLKNIISRNPNGAHVATHRTCTCGFRLGFETGVFRGFETGFS
jgi:hypothetical protein